MNVKTVRETLDRNGLRLSKELGQNFLIDVNLQKLLVRTGNLGPQDVVLEVGTGTGALTELMAQEAAAVVTVEVDGRIVPSIANELTVDDRTILCREVAIDGKQGVFGFESECRNELIPSIDQFFRIQLPDAAGPVAEAHRGFDLSAGELGNPARHPLEIRIRGIFE